MYEDRLSDHIPEELWTTKSAEPQEELRRVRTEMERHEVASQAHETAGLQILELAQTAYSSCVAKNPHEQARLVKTVVSNSTFDRGSLCPTCVKPFDVFATGRKTVDWLAILVIGVLLWLSSAGIGTHPFYRGALMIGTLVFCACTAADKKTGAT